MNSRILFRTSFVRVAAVVVVCIALGSSRNAVTADPIAELDSAIKQIEDLPVGSGDTASTAQFLTNAYTFMENAFGELQTGTVSSASGLAAADAAAGQPVYSIQKRVTRTDNYTVSVPITETRTRTVFVCRFVWVRQGCCMVRKAMWIPQQQTYAVTRQQIETRTRLYQALEQKDITAEITKARNLQVAIQQGVNQQGTPIVGTVHKLVDQLIDLRQEIQVASQ